jgi:hypothetical protein
VEILDTIDLDSSAVVLRRAGASDVPAIVGLLADDHLGATRDWMRTAEDLAAYQAAFEAIDRDPAHLLVVGQSGPDIVATMQMSFLPGLARRGALRAQIEAVRVLRRTAAAASALSSSPGRSAKPGGGTAPWCS